MSDLPQTDPTPAPTDTPPQTNGGTQGEGGDPSWLPARLQRAQEAERKKLLAELGIEDPKLAKQLIEEAQKRKQDEMTELQKAQARIAELEPKAEEVVRIKAALQDTVEKRIEALPKEWRDAVPEYEDPTKTLAWLDKNAEKLSRPQAPNMDAGVTGDKVPPPPTQEAQRAASIAAQYGYTIDPKKVAERQRQIEQQRQRGVTRED